MKAMETYCPSCKENTANRISVLMLISFFFIARKHQGLLKTKKLVD